MSINVAIIFAKKENTDFDRYTFPLLNRPVAYYPIYAALNTSSIDQVYLSTDSPRLSLYGSRIDGLKLIPREYSQETLTEEIQKSIHFVRNNNVEKINLISIHFANSPCITDEMIFNAISFLDNNPEYDTVATCMRRGEFSPARMFSYEHGKLSHNKDHIHYKENVYFLDHRLMVIRSDSIFNIHTKSDCIEYILGEKIHPVIQQEGIWDIDYPWQIPHIEKWLRQNNFTETKTIYPANRCIISNKTEANRFNNSKVNLLVTTVPFGEIDPLPLDMLEQNGNVKYIINPLNRKLKEDELGEMISDYDILIAGTEPITAKVLNNAKRLKMISRVGIGLDNVDLLKARKLGIRVSFTPDAPSPAVAELTMAHIINLLRHVPSVDQKIRAGIWSRIQGRRLANMTIGIIGAGRIGMRVIKHLQGFNPSAILVNDLLPQKDIYRIYNARYAEKEEIYRFADVISIHVPLTRQTKNMITEETMKLMKSTTILINTSRGGIINENDLYNALKHKKLGGAALDVFDIEPYSGNLVELENCYFTCHMGSMTKDCRARMEIEATEEVIRYLKGEELLSPVPEEEYQNQQAG